jgi:hypothetical protein
VEPLPCPACGYDLRATPESPRCPECGLVNDVHLSRERIAARAWRLTMRNSQWLAGASGVIAIVGWCAGLALELLRPSAPAVSDESMWFAVLLLGYIGLVLLAIASLGVNLPPRRHISIPLAAISTLQAATVLGVPACCLLGAAFPPLLGAWLVTVGLIPLAAAVGLVRAAGILRAERRTAPIAAAVVVSASTTVAVILALRPSLPGAPGIGAMGAIGYLLHLTVGTAALQWSFVAVRRQIDRYESDLRGDG